MRFNALRQKGYALTADGVLAVLIFAAILFFITGARISEDTVSAKIILTKQADDLLDLLDREDTLETFDGNIISEKINLSLPARIDWKMLVEKYELKSGDFNKVSEKSFGNSSAGLSGVDFVKARRIFVTFKNQEIQFYYNSELWVWLK